MKDLISIAAFMKRNIPILRYTPRGTLLSWLNWHTQHRSLAFVEKDDKVIAAGTARVINERILELMDDDLKVIRDIANYMTDENGTIVYAEQAASLSPKGLEGILIAMKNRFPNAKEFIFKKKKRKAKYKKYDLTKFVRKAGK